MTSYERRVDHRLAHQQIGELPGGRVAARLDPVLPALPDSAQLVDELAAVADGPEAGALR